MNSPKGVKSGVAERLSISYPHVAPVTTHKLITGDQCMLTYQLIIM